MLMVSVHVARVTEDRVEILLTLPPGFRLEQVDGPSLRANDELPAAQWGEDPKRARPSDLFRGFRASFDRAALEAIIDRRGPGSALTVRGSLRNRARIEGSCALPESLLPLPGRASRRSNSSTGSPS